jgi:TolA-binding protein
MRLNRAIVAAAVVAAELALGSAPARAQMSLAQGFLPANEIALQDYSAEFPPIGPTYSTTTRSWVLRTYLERLLKEAPDAPETFETLVQVERAAGLNRNPTAVAAALRRMIQNQPERLAWAFGVLSPRRTVDDPFAFGADDPLPQLIVEARGALGRLPAADAARLELALTLADRSMRGAGPNPARANALRSFIAKHPGTDAALEAEVELITSTTARAAWRQPLEEFARQHPPTTAAAKALFEKAFQITRNPITRDLNRPDQGPTDPFLEALAIVRDLGSGRYPASEWVARAPWLAIEMRHATSATGDVDRLLAAYVEFVRENFTLPEASLIAEGVNSVITNQIFELFALKGEGVAGVERTLTDLEQLDAPRARFVRATFYIDGLADEPEATRPALRQKAVETLSALAGSGTGLYARRALATLASLQYSERNFAEAQLAFARYLDAYPNTPWSSIAAIRIGQCHELAGNLNAAIDAYRNAAVRFGSISLVRALARAYAGRVSDAAGRPEDAAAEYELALEGWGNLQRAARMETYQVADMVEGMPVEVEGLALKARLDEIRASLATAEGRQLETGRRLLAANDRAAALVAFESFIRTYPASRLVPEARRLTSRIRIEQAIAQAGPVNAPRDTASAIATLAAVQSEAWDEFAGVGRIVAATLTLRNGTRAQADAMITAALREWRDKQTIAPSTLPADVAADVAAIRRQIFEGEDSAAWAWRFGWNRASPAFLVVNPHIAVQLPNATAARETVYPVSTLSPLFMTTEAMTLLVDSLNALAEENPERRSVARVPVEMRNFLGTHLPLEMGMLWSTGITSFASIPNVCAVVFTNAERTRANVEIRTSSSGGTLVMERTAAGWRVVSVGDTYVN